MEIIFLLEVSKSFDDEIERFQNPCTSNRSLTHPHLCVQHCLSIWMIWVSQAVSKVLALKIQFKVGKVLTSMGGQVMSSYDRFNTDKMLWLILQQAVLRIAIDQFLIPLLIMIRRKECWL